jgi:hypothetical protein
MRILLLITLFIFALCFENDMTMMSQIAILNENKQGINPQDCRNTTFGVKGVN